MNDILLIIILIINSISMLGSFILLTILFIKKTKEEKNISPPAESPIKNIKYTNTLLESTRSIINTVTYMELKTFVDNNEPSMVSKAQLADLAKQIANKVHSSINYQNIDFNYVIFSRDYFDEYIIKFTINALKQLWENIIREMTE